MLDREIDLKSIAETKYIRIDGGSQNYFHFRVPCEERKLNVRFSGVENIWSPPFYLDRLGKIFLRLCSVNSHEPQVVRVSVILRKATLVIAFSENRGPLPYIIENQLDFPIIIHQKVSLICRPSITSGSFPLTLPMKGITVTYTIEAHQSFPFIWDDPSFEDKRLVINIRGKTREINPVKMGNRKPISFPVSS